VGVQTELRIDPKKSLAIGKKREHDRGEVQHGKARSGPIVESGQGYLFGIQTEKSWVKTWWNRRENDAVEGMITWIKGELY